MSLGDAQGAAEGVVDFGRGIDAEEGENCRRQVAGSDEFWSGYSPSLSLDPYSAPPATRVAAGAGREIESLRKSGEYAVAAFV